MLFKPIILKLLIVLNLSIFINLININLVFSQERINNEEQTQNSDNVIEEDNCQNINLECLDDLSNKAIASSLIITEIKDKIELINKQIN